MSTDLLAIRTELDEFGKTLLSAINAVRALKVACTDTAERVTILEDQMRKRVYVSPVHKNLIQKAVNNKVRALTEKYCIDYKIGSKRLFQALWRSLKDKYSISVYSELPDIEFDTALEFIRTWEDEVFINRLKDDLVA